MSLADIDALTAKIHWPRGATALTKTYFQDRVVVGTDAHLKAFAGEVFTVAVALACFVDVVLVPAGKLRDHVACFQHMCHILEILQTGDLAVPRAAELACCVRAYQTLFLQLYEECAKPKLHYLWHIPESLAHFQRNLNCFNPERMHKSVKATANHCFRYLESHTVAKLLQGMLWHVEHDPYVFHAHHLCDPRPAPSMLDWLRLLLPTARDPQVSRVAHTEHGYVHAGDLLQLTGDDIKVDVAKFFLQVSDSGCLTPLGARPAMA